MMTSNLPKELENFDIEQLTAISKNAQALIQKKQKQKLYDAYGQLEQIAKEMDCTVQDILAAGSELEYERNIKYRHPDDPSKNWTGRGRMAKWLKEEIEGGKALEDFAV